MNLTFATRLICLLYLIAFAFKLMLGDRPVAWLDWMSGIVFAISVYHLMPPIDKFLRGRKRR